MELGCGDVWQVHVSGWNQHSCCELHTELPVGGVEGVGGFGRNGRKEWAEDEVGVGEVDVGEDLEGAVAGAGLAARGVSRYTSTVPVNPLPQCKPALIRTEHASLVGLAIERAPGIDTVVQVIWVVLAPVAAEDVSEDFTEGIVLPSLDGAAYNSVGSVTSG